MGKIREKGWEERDPKAHPRNSDFGTPNDLGTFSALPNKHKYTRHKTHRLLQILFLHEPIPGQCMDTGKRSIVVGFARAHCKQYHIQCEIESCITVNRMLLLLSNIQGK